VQTEKEKDLGNYQMDLCADDGYANPTCARFTLSVEDPLKTKKKKSSLDADSGND
jgi:hypothetical protein